VAAKGSRAGQGVRGNRASLRRRRKQPSRACRGGGGSRVGRWEKFSLPAEEADQVDGAGGCCAAGGGGGGAAGRRRGKNRSGSSVANGMGRRGQGLL
jgi:hypothetical protein